MKLIAYAIAKRWRNVLLIDPEKTLDQNLQAMHQKHPPRKRKRYSKTLSEAIAVLKTNNLRPAMMLRPIEYLEKHQAQTQVALRIVRDAELEGIPLVADVEQQRWALSSIVVRHYDFGRDLSLSEIRVIQQLAKVAAAKCDCEIHFTLETLRFAITENPVSQKTSKRLEEIAQETDAAIAKYIEACRPDLSSNRSER